MSSGRENYVCSLRTTSIWKEILLVGNTVYGPDKKDVVVVTDITSQTTVAILIAELKYKELLHYRFGPDNTRSARSRKILEVNFLTYFKKLFFINWLIVLDEEVIEVKISVNLESSV